jgi:hypothetical protein
MKRLLICGVALGFLFALGCGGSDDDSGPSASTSVENLTQAESKSLCEKWEGKAESAFDGQHFGCVMAGMMSGLGDATLCQTAYDACMEQPYEAEPSDCADSYTTTSDCPNITVGEVETCMQDQLDAISAAVSGLSCDTPPEDLEGLGESMDTVPASCKTIEEKCPAFFD